MSSGRQRRNYRRLILISVTLLAYLFAGLVFFRLSIGELIAHNILQSYGFDRAQITIKHIGLEEVQIAKVSLDEKFELEKIAIGYSAASLSQGTVDWISVSGVAANVSDPDKGALKTILDIARGEEKPADKTEPLILPSINVTNGKITGTFDTRSFQSEFGFTLTPELKVEGELKLSGQIETNAGLIRAEGIVAKFEGDIPHNSGTIDLKNGVIRQDKDVPDWTPFSISGNAGIEEQKIDFIASVGLRTDDPLFRVEGWHDLRKKTGKMDIDIQDITFDKAGLQPVNLSPFLSIVPPVDALLSSQSHLSWDEDILTLESLVFAKDAVVIGPDFSVETGLVNMAIKAFYNVKNGKHQVNLRTEELTAIVNRQDKKYAIDEFKFNLDVEEKGKAFNLHDVTVSFRHIAQNQDFVPLTLMAKGNTKNGDILFTGKIVDEKSRLSMPFEGRHSLGNNKGSGQASLNFAKFTRNGLQPKDLSSMFRDIPGKVVGKLETTILAKWEPEIGISIGNIKGRLTEGAFSNRDIGIYDANLDFSAENIREDLPFEVKIFNAGGGLVANKRHASLRGLSTRVDVKKGWKDADIHLDKAILIFGEGTYFKPDIHLKGFSSFTKGVFDFKGEGITDYLGPFLTLTGTHNINTGKGEAIVQLAPIEFEEDGLELTDLVELSEPALILNGKIANNLQFGWGETGVSRQANITLDNLDIGKEDMQISGLTGTISIDELQPFTISTTQEITANKIVAGVTLSQPNIKFRVATVKENPVLYLDELKIGIIGGNAVIKNAVLDTGIKLNKINVQLSNIDLEKVLALGDVEDVTASGTLNGKIPLIFDSETLLIDAGVLETDGPGVLQLKSEKARAALAGGGDQTKLLFDILENFQYTELSVQIKKLASGEDTVLLHTKGSNPNIENSRPVVLNINLSTNLGKIFNTLLDGYRLSEKALRATVNKRQN